jgi:nucleoside-diphosphate-sugar epimerase
MKVLVTGATGFVGQHLTRRLVGSHDVRVFARDPERARSLFGETVEIHAGDLRDVDAVRRSFEGVEMAYHLGAQRDHWGTPRRVYMGCNVDGTRNVLDAAGAADVSKLVYCSSVGVYAYDFQRLPVDETHPYGRRFGHYHESKKLAEEIVLRSRLPIVTVRPGWIYGPHDDSGGITKMLIRASRGRMAFVGPGANRVHPVYIDDVVDGILAAGRSDRYGDVFLLLGPRALTVREYVLAMCDAVGAEPPRIRIPYAFARLACYALEPAWSLKNRVAGTELFGDRPPVTRESLAGLTTDRVYDVSKATRLLGHTPSVDVEEGLARTVRWLADAGMLRRGDASQPPDGHPRRAAARSDDP